MAGWLGDGSFSVQASVDGTPARVALSGLDVSAGLLRAGGDLAVSGLDTGRPIVTGTVDADTLPLPAVRLRSADPLPFELLRGWEGAVRVLAGHVLAGLSPVLTDAAANMTLSHGTLSVDGAASGGFAGRASISDANPPRLALAATLRGVKLDGAWTGLPLDLPSGTLDASVELSATGYSPAGLLATVAGPVRTTVSDGTLSGLDAGRVLSLLGSPDTAVPAVAAALEGGSTGFSRLDAAATALGGVLLLDGAAAATPFGSLAATGSLDLAGAAVDLHLLLQPALEGAPAVGLRLIGRLAAPNRTLELADLARWLATR